METYDYREKAGCVNEMQTKIDTISENQAKAVSEYIDLLKNKEAEEQASYTLDWLTSTIIPILQNFAKMTCSCLNLEQQNKFVMIATLTNSEGFDILESCKSMRTLLNLASHIGINSKGDETSLTLIFDCGNLLDSI